ncbi:MAG: carboxymuconolactone decarboxylase family protein [Marmoricola sp.]
MNDPRSRLRPILPADLDAGQASLYASITEGPRAQGPAHFDLTGADGSLLGPFNALLLSPDLGAALQGVGVAVRYRSTLSARTREIAILTVAAHWDCAFERAAHQRVGRAVGLTDHEVSEISAGRVPALEDPHEQACAHLVRAMVEGDVDDEAWSAWAETSGKSTVFELTTLVGYYATLALQLRVFRAE